MCQVAKSATGANYFEYKEMDVRQKLQNYSEITLTCVCACA